MQIEAVDQTVCICIILAEINCCIHCVKEFPAQLSAVFVFAFIGAWNELIAGTIFLNTQKMWTSPIGLKALVGKHNVEWGAMMAGGVLALLPTAIMFVFVQKYIVEGLTAGAVKG